MKVWPQSLLWRTFLFIALLMVLSVLAWAGIFARAEREPRAHQLAQMVVSVVNLTRSALVSAQPTKRRELLREFSEREGIRIYPVEDNEVVAPLPAHPLLRMIAENIRQQLGEQTRITTEREGIHAFWVSFRIDDDEYWVMLPRERVADAFTWQWLGWGSAALVLALVGAYLIMFRVTRPLKALASAAAEVGNGRAPRHLEERGPGEIQTVARAFNQMSLDLARLDADRALILAGISHDLRTPLARLRLAAEMSGADDAMCDDMVTDIEEMDQIIGQFLDFARDLHGEPLELIDLNTLVNKVVEQYQRRGASFELHPGNLPQTQLRPLAMRRVISNLLNNALLYGGNTNPVAINSRSEGGNVVLEVQDHGPGIPVEEVERLKQPFTRLEAARTGTMGAGLGLAIIDRIVRSHGGVFELLQREGGGLIARVSIPVT